MKKISMIFVSFLTAILVFGSRSNSFAMAFSSYDSLIAFYPFNGNANDESGNGHDGNINGNATLTSDRFMVENRAYSFLDQSSNITLANTSNLNLESGFTINAWVKYKNNNITAVIVCKHVCGFVNGLFFGIDTDGQIQLWIANSIWSTVRTNKTFIENRWYMMTTSYDAGTGIAKIYIDGEISGSGNVTYTNFSSNPISIGESYNNNCGPGNLSGAVDEVKIYNRPLSDAEIIEEYNSSRNNLVAYYPFNGNANDESGNGHDGTVYGGVLTADRNGNSNRAYTFPNSPDQIVLSNSTNLNLLGGFTLNTWIKYKNADCHIISKHNCYTYNSFALAIYIGQIELFLGDGGSWNTVATNQTFTENQWYMVSAVYDSVNKTASIFINGQLKASGTANYTTPNNAPITISGATGSCPAINMSGAIDEVKIFDRPLTTQEILAEYNSSQIGLVSFYPFNGNADDASGNMNNGIVYNAVLTSDRYGEANKSYLFNGTDSYIEGMNPGFNLPSGNSSRSFTAWVKDYSYYYWGCNIFHYGTAESAPTNFHFLITDVLGLGNGYGYGVTYGNTNLIDSTWHFVCGTYTDTDQIVRLYVDGKSDHSEILPTAPNTLLSTNWRIGLFMAGGTPFNGKLDEIRVYTQALPETDIISLYFSETTAPSLQQPEDGSEVTTLTPVMQWNSSFTNPEYKFQLSSDSTFSNVLYEINTINSNVQLPEGILSEGVNYYWHAKTTLNGETGPWSEVWRFTFLNTGLEKKIVTFPAFTMQPNPSDISVKISYFVPISNGGSLPVSIEIVNSIGKIIANPVNKKLATGNYEISFNTRELKPGIYFCRLIAGNEILIRKLVILH